MGSGIKNVFARSGAVPGDEARAEPSRLGRWRPSPRTQKAFAYAALAGAMAGAVFGSIAVGSYVTDRLAGSAAKALQGLPEGSLSFKFYSALADRKGSVISSANTLWGTISALVTVNLGAPIFEPLGARFRKLTYSLSQPIEDDGQSKDSAELERFWLRTQANYSHNGNMARSVLNHFLASIQQNVGTSYQVMRAGGGAEDVRYAAARLAEALVRMRTLFTEFAPDEGTVARLVHTALTDHLPPQRRSELREVTAAVLRELDCETGMAKVRDYYERALTAWVGPRIASERG